MNDVMIWLTILMLTALAAGCIAAFLASVLAEVRKEFRK